MRPTKPLNARDDAIAAGIRYCLWTRQPRWTYDEKPIHQNLIFNPRDDKTLLDSTVIIAANLILGVVPYTHEGRHGRPRHLRADQKTLNVACAPIKTRTETQILQTAQQAAWNYIHDQLARGRQPDHSLLIHGAHEHTTADWIELPNFSSELEFRRHYLNEWTDGRL